MKETSQNFWFNGSHLTPQPGAMGGPARVFLSANAAEGDGRAIAYMTLQAAEAVPLSREDMVVLKKIVDSVLAVMDGTYVKEEIWA